MDISRLGLTALLLAATSTELTSESVTLTTYYPSPYAVYGAMNVTGNTQLASASGSVTMGNASAAPSQVNATVNGALQVNGAMRVNNVLHLGNMTANPWSTVSNGALYYNTTSHSFMGMQAGAWSKMGIAVLGGGYVPNIQPNYDIGEVKNLAILTGVYNPTGGSDATPAGGLIYKQDGVMYAALYSAGAHREFALTSSETCTLVNGVINANHLLCARMGSNGHVILRTGPWHWITYVRL